MAGPEFLTTAIGVIAIEPPPGWVVEKTKHNPFFLLRIGDRYENARTVIYINVQVLDGTFEQAVANDERDFRRDDPSVQIQSEPQPEILERGCAVKTQRFIYEHKQKTSVDQVTKIAIDGLLLNVVLSSDSETEIARYQKDYEQLLMHLGLVMSRP
jgi:hypothetical protein